jgi:hypothetical protein
MKKQKTVLASLALGIFLFAMAAPIISSDTFSQELGVDKTKVKIPGRNR